jgi:hypothetical protein
VLHQSQYAEKTNPDTAVTTMRTIHRRPSSGGCGAFRLAAFDAEFVAHRISHDDETAAVGLAVVVHHGCADPDQSFDLLVSGQVDGLHVYVQAVLYDLLFRDVDE